MSNKKNDREVLEAVTTLAGLYSLIPIEIVRKHASLKPSRLTVQTDNFLPLAITKLKEGIENEEHTIRGYHMEKEALLRQKLKTTMKHEEVVASLKRQLAAKERQALDDRLSFEDEDAILAESVANCEGKRNTLNVYLEDKEKELAFCDYLLWGGSSKIYGKISLADVREDMELESPTAILITTQPKPLYDKLERLQRMGFEANQFFVKNKFKWATSGGRSAHIKTGHASVTELQQRLLDYLGFNMEGADREAEALAPVPDREAEARAPVPDREEAEARAPVPGMSSDEPALVRSFIQEDDENEDPEYLAMRKRWQAEKQEYLKRSAAKKRRDSLTLAEIQSPLQTLPAPSPSSSTQKKRKLF